MGMDKRIFWKTIAIGVLSSVIAIILNDYEVSALPEPREEAIMEVEIKGKWKGYHCGYVDSERLVIETEGEWKEVWEKVVGFQIPKPKLPEVDFETEMIIAVFMGEQRTGGYSIDITRIIKEEEEIVVQVKEKHPDPDLLVTMALTQPYHIVVVKSSPLPVRFQHP